MKKAVLITLAFLAALSFVPTANAAQVAIKGTLILASNEGSGIEPSLKRYSTQLQRLGFKSYRVIGAGGTRIQLPGEGKMSLGKGFMTQITAQGAGKRINVKMRLVKGNKTLAGYSGPLPLVVGGPRYQNGNLILILDGR